MLIRPGHRWPILIGSNRDELMSRSWEAPGRHWPGHPDVIGGRDLLAGGTWMGLNKSRVVACLLNRHATLDLAERKRSRGELVLNALNHSSAENAAHAVSRVDSGTYRPFNLIIADSISVWWLASREGARSVVLEKVPEGYSMFTEGDRNDVTETRIGQFLSAFKLAMPPEPEANDWSTWANILAECGPNEHSGHGDEFVKNPDFATSSCSMLALPSNQSALNEGLEPLWQIVAGSPASKAFTPVGLHYTPVGLH